MCGVLNIIFIISYKQFISIFSIWTLHCILNEFYFVCLNLRWSIGCAAPMGRLRQDGRVTWILTLWGHSGTVTNAAFKEIFWNSLIDILKQFFIVLRHWIIQMFDSYLVFIFCRPDNQINFISTVWSSLQWWPLTRPGVRGCFLEGALIRFETTLRWSMQAKT